MAINITRTNAIIADKLTGYLDPSHSISIDIIDFSVLNKTVGPDLSPTDCYLFKHFQNSLAAKTFTNQDQAKTALDFAES